MDPLEWIFRPGGLTVAAFVFGAPLLALTYAAWRHVARGRLRRQCCGHCGAPWAPAGERFLMTGIEICAPCAAVMRRRLWVLLPAVALFALTFAVTSGTAFVVSQLRGGPELAWWLDGRWIPLLAPSVGVVLVARWVMRRAKRANNGALHQRAASLLQAPAPSLAAAGANRARELEQPRR